MGWKAHWQKHSYDDVLSVSMTFSINGLQALQHRWKICEYCKGTLLKNKYHLVTFHKRTLVSLWKFSADSRIYIYIYIYSNKTNRNISLMFPFFLSIILNEFIVRKNAFVEKFFFLVNVFNNFDMSQEKWLKCNGDTAYPFFEGKPFSDLKCLQLLLIAIISEVKASG